MKKNLSIAALLLLPLMVTDLIPAVCAYAEPRPLQGVKWPLAVGEEVFSFPAKFPAAKKMYYLEGSPGVPLSKLINLTMFGGFQPGWTIDEAIARFGRPSATRSDKRNSVAVYELPAVRIEVEDHTYNTVFTAHSRTVYAYPKASAACTTVASILHPSVVSLIPAKGTVQLHLEESGGFGEFAFVLVKDGCIEAINWGKTPNKS